MKIGFVGLGIMGRPMALNLLRSGCELYVNDLNEAAVKALCDKGAIAASQAEIAESCEAVFTILPNGSIRYCWGRTACWPIWLPVRWRWT